MTDSASPDTREQPFDLERIERVWHEQGVMKNADVPKVIREIRRLQAEVERLRAYVAKLETPMSEDECEELGKILGMR